jgi:hypothetical protein
MPEAPEACRRDCSRKPVVCSPKPVIRPEACSPKPAAWNAVSGAAPMFPVAHYPPHFAKRRKKLSSFHAGRVGRLATVSTSAT